MSQDFTLMLSVAVILGWLIGAFFVAWAAQEKGRSGGWFVIGLVLGPILATLLLIAVPVKDTLTERASRCPFCRSLNARDAIVCAHCGRESDPLPEDGEL